jgi:hypothetical protein
VWKKCGVVSRSFLVGFVSGVEPRSMLEPASSKMAATLAMSYPRLVRWVATSLGMLMKSSSFVFCFRYLRRFPMMVLFSLPLGCAEPLGVYRWGFIVFWYVQKLKWPLVGSRVMLRLSNTMWKVS